MLTTILVFLLVIGLLIFAHELGHFLLARLCGVGVETFSLGFGPRLFGKVVNGTDYRVSAFPLGGYVKMVGEDPGDEVDEADLDVSFSAKPVYMRAMIAAFGPLFNLGLSFVIFSGLFAAGSLSVLAPVVSDVLEETPAAAAGIQPGDRIVSVDGKNVNSWDDLALFIQEGKGGPLAIRVDREGRTLDLTVTPDKIPTRNLLGESQEAYQIGVANKDNLRDLNLIQALAHGARSTWDWVKLTGWFVSKMFTGSVPFRALGGPIQIAQETGKQARQGIVSLLYLIAVISVNLGLVNLLPIPVLDGGHLLFLGIEAVTRRPVGLKVREIATQIGLVLLITLMLFVFYNDILRTRMQSNVLLVDGGDDHVLSYILKLESNGKHLYPVGGIQKALDVLDKKDAPRMDVILLDASDNPEGLAGTVAAIREKSPQTKVILLIDPDFSEGLVEGVFGSLEKPVAFEPLLEMLEKARLDRTGEEKIPESTG